jgi:hypothetical protein
MTLEADAHPAGPNFGLLVCLISCLCFWIALACALVVFIN